MESMDNRKLVKTSKRLSLILRHHPESVGLTLDPAGWVTVDALLAALDGRVTRAELEAVVAGNDKQRFAFDDTGTRIRANQGHTVPVDLGYAEAEPPAVLFHGTHPGALNAILRSGLTPMTRHDVHLSADVATATRVGARRGRPVVLEVDAAAMHAAGARFRVSANGVWLTEAVPPEFLRVVGSSD